MALTQWLPSKFFIGVFVYNLMPSLSGVWCCMWGTQKALAVHLLLWCSRQKGNPTFGVGNLRCGYSCALLVWISSFMFHDFLDHSFYNGFTPSHAHYMFCTKSHLVLRWVNLSFLLLSQLNKLSSWCFWRWIWLWRAASTNVYKVWTLSGRLCNDVPHEAKNEKDLDQVLQVLAGFQHMMF